MVQVWVCEFCRCENAANDSVKGECVAPARAHARARARAHAHADHLYLLAQSDDDYQNLEDTLVVFCVDISGSMSVTAEVTSSSGSPVYISRLEGIQDALQRALSSMLQQSPHRRVALVTFNDEVVIYGDGTGTPLTLRDWALVDYDHIWQQGVAYSIPHCIAETHHQLVQRVNDLREHGATCLGPAALASVAMASRYPGSKVILCTDGKANIGLGEMELTPSLPSSLLTPYFYRQLALQAVGSGVIISVITFEGTDCRLADVGRLADATGGRVNIVSIDAVATEIQLASVDNILATGVTATVFAPDGVYFPYEDENNHTLVREIGNVTKGLEITIQFAVKPEFTEVFLQRDTLPFQLQLSFKTRDRQGLTRVITEQRPVTTCSRISAGNLNMAVLGVHCAQLSASLTMEGRVQEAQRQLKARQDLHKQISKQRPFQEEESIYGNWMDTMTTICDDITMESQTLSDEAAKIMYQMKRASSVSNNHNNSSSNTIEIQKKTRRKTKVLMDTMMSLCGSFLSDEQFLCSICLDVFTNPSTTPCGHSFCMACISKYWDGSKVYQCPLCKKTFRKQPELQINRTLREITIEFKSMTGGGNNKRGGRGGGGAGGAAGAAGAAGAEGRMGGGGGIPGDLIEELKKKLPRSTLYTSLPMPCEIQESMLTTPDSTPMASSVPNHSTTAALTNPSGNSLPSPYNWRGRRRFTVTGAAISTRLPVCEIHHRGIVIYCKTDQVCICPECETEYHQDHDTVTLEAEWTETKDQLSESEKEFKEMIRQRIRKIEEIKLSSTELELAVEHHTAGSVCLFSELVSTIERSQAELLEAMETSRRAAALQADAMIRQLELEVEELRRRGSGLAQLAQSDDYIHCVKTFPTLSIPPPVKDWSGVSVTSDLGTGPIYRSLAALLEKFQEELLIIAEAGFPDSALALGQVPHQPKTTRVEEYAVDVTLDVNTAHPRLILSEDMKSVRCTDRHQMLPDNPERFDRVVCVVGREAISSGRHYWEVEVGGKTDWDLGVARQSINRKGKIEVTPSNGYWFLSLRNRKKYAFRSEPSTDVHLDLRPHRIGIFVDFEKGQVSFYNVDAKIHIYTFSDTFSECIFPFFSPCTNKSGKNDGPLIITPVYTTE
ncbi:uncharacterized protein LOC117747493 isoform X2 [Cyclopterus lumpus]|nr:uncharacterized protein LOC117747493 isoform X2 [Cyclopterus lumpus]XP_034412657.1 uncharacterized protein LOC117747493 isoform X2 [Cyclopterus lumpus]